MTDNENIVTDVENNDTDYIAVIQEMRENTVSRDEYNKLKAENKKLFSALAAGEKIEVPKEPTKTIDELRADVRKAESSLDGWKACLALRDAVLEKTGQDVFVATGTKIIPTDEDRTKATHVAETVKGWIEESGDDPFVFANIMSRNIIDSVPSRRK